MKHIAKKVGILFILVSVTSYLGSGIVEDLMYHDDYLTISSSNKYKWMIGLLIHFLSSIGTIGIVVLMYPLLKQQSRYIGIVYIIFRCLEAFMFVLTELNSTSILTLSQLYTTLGSESIGHIKLMGEVVQEGRKLTYGIGLLFFCFASFPFYYSMYKSSLLPKFITLWGIYSIILAFIKSTLNVIGIPTPTLISIICFVPIALNEIIMSVWLIFKGFNQPKHLDEKI